MECVELAPAVGCVARFESGSKLHALHTLRAIWFRLCRPEDRRALPPGVTDRFQKLLTPTLTFQALHVSIGRSLKRRDEKVLFLASLFADPLRRAEEFSKTLCTI